MHSQITMKGNKKNVFETYNKIAEWYAENHYCGLVQKDYLDQIIKHIGNKGTVLDIGCGTALPIMGYFLSLEIPTTGIDASHRMLAIAKKNFPEAEFLQHDMRTLALNRKFDAILAWNSFFHLPTSDQPAMFSIFKNHLNKNGILMFTSGKEHGEAWGINGGENLYHASLSTEEYNDLLKKHGFKVIRYTADDANCGGATVWIAKLERANTYSIKGIPVSSLIISRH